MKLIKLSDLFDISYGTKLDMNKMTVLKTSTLNFISRTSKNNGVAGYVEPFKNVMPLERDQITVSLGGTYVLSSFLQEEEFYTGQNVAVLKPLLTMSKEQKLYYCMAITKNRFRYAAFGREANRTLKDLKVPALSEVPNFVKEVNFKKFDDINNVYLKNENLLLNTEKWQYFNFNELFTIKKGFYNKKPPVTNKTECVPFVGASEYNNGITSYIIKENIEKYSKVGKIDSSELISNKIFKSNCITVANNGASVASSFYQEKDFTCSHDVNILYLKEFTLNKYIALFLITLIKSEKYRWTYGRKWRIQRMEKSAIKLPITKKNTPDWSFMEEYIKSLPFSHSV